MDYLLLKTVHIALALFSVTGFAVRWTWRTMDSPISSARLTRILPHVIDTLFLASGVLLTMTIAQYPLRNGWLTAKICGLVVYILLGVAAMSRRLSRPVRVAAFIAALLVFGWIVSVARLKTGWGLFGL